MPEGPRTEFRVGPGDPSIQLNGHRLGNCLPRAMELGECQYPNPLPSYHNNKTVLAIPTTPCTHTTSNNLSNQHICKTPQMHICTTQTLQPERTLLVQNNTKTTPKNNLKASHPTRMKEIPKERNLQNTKSTKISTISTPRSVSLLEKLRILFRS